MRNIILAFLLFLSSINVRADSSFPSPDGTCEARIAEDEFRVSNLTITRGDKRLFSMPSGYRGFTAVVWSPDSTYLAVVEHGTKTTMTLAVYLIEPNEVKSISLPAYRLNILGRYQRVEGGRYRFDEDLKWRKADVLEFVTRGSLVDGASNPQDNPENWYSFVVGIEFATDRAHLLTVTPNVADKPGTGQPATRPEPKTEGSDKPQPEAEGRSR
jgi:hypothetical protein